MRLRLELATLIRVPRLAAKLGSKCRFVVDRRGVVTGVNRQDSIVFEVLVAVSLYAEVVWLATFSPRENAC